MAENQHHPATGKTVSWHVYIVRCRDGSYYTGITTDLVRRVEQHNSAAGGAGYTRPRRPVTLVYSETAGDRAAATRRELELKRLPRHQKQRLVEGFPAGLAHTDRPAAPG
jgi:putative endonuclease